jgi:hypothetical protein
MKTFSVVGLVQDDEGSFLVTSGCKFPGGDGFNDVDLPIRTLSRVLRELGVEVLDAAYFFSRHEGGVTCYAYLGFARENRDAR